MPAGVIGVPREWIYFISHSGIARIFHNGVSHYFTFARGQIFHCLSQYETKHLLIKRMALFQQVFFYSIIDCPYEHRASGWFLFNDVCPLLQGKRGQMMPCLRHNNALRRCRNMMRCVPPESCAQRASFAAGDHHLRSCIMFRPRNASF